MKLLVIGKVRELSHQAIDEVSKPKTVDEVRLNGPMIDFSTEMAEKQLELKQFLRKSLYLHSKVTEMTDKAAKTIEGLFKVYMDDLNLIPSDYQSIGKEEKPRVIADYIAGMTDRYAIREYEKLLLNQ